MSTFTKEELFLLIETETRQKNVAQQRGEYDVVAWHQKGIDKWKCYINDLNK